MNLLQDAWIPVKKGEDVFHISMKDLLCGEESFQLSHPRDDMELAALQLVVCITQCIFMPENKKERRKASMSPMAEAEYDDGIGDYAKWFSLDDKLYPFMQDTAAKDEVITGIQKLFPGMPEGDGSATLFVSEDAITRACSSCTAIALFNQAANAPSFGGGTKGPLRGSAPVTMFVYSPCLRKMVWENVLTSDWLEEKWVHADASENTPVWVDKIKRGADISTASIGLLRGFFWQPAYLFMEWKDKDEEIICPCCGRKSRRFCETFRKNKFAYNLVGTWRHPHSPYCYDEKKKEQYAVSFNKNTGLPLWGRICELLPKQKDKISMGSLPIEQYIGNREGKRMPLVVGGYRNQKASITERRHEMFSISSDWISEKERLEELHNAILTALSFCDHLRKTAYFFGKDIDKASKIPDGTANEAQSLFFQRTESLMHKFIAVSRENASLYDLARNLKVICEEIFEEITKPYLGSVKAIKSYSLKQKMLSKEFYKILEDLSPKKA